MSGFPEGDRRHELLPTDTLDRVSVFETLRAYGGAIFGLNEHLARLGESCRGLSRELPLSAAELSRWLKKMLTASGIPDALLRVSLHWEAGDGRVLLFVREFTAHPEALYENGVELKTSVLRRPEPRAVDAQIKSSQYTAGVLAYLDRLEDPAHEILFLDGHLRVAEGSVSNIFIVKERSLLTPPAASGILRGVTRSHVMRLAERAGHPVRETAFTRHDIYNADECFMTNTSSEVLPVTAVDGRRIADGRPGPVSRQLKKDFKK